MFKPHQYTFSLHIARITLCLPTPQLVSRYHLRIDPNGEADSFCELPFQQQPRTREINKRDILRFRNVNTPATPARFSLPSFRISQTPRDNFLRSGSISQHLARESFLSTAFTVLSTLSASHFTTAILPNELLSEICAYGDAATLKQLRLVDRIMNAFAAKFLFEEVYLILLPESIENVRKIVRHPVYKHYVRCLRYFADRLSLRFEEYETWKAHALRASTDMSCPFTCIGGMKTSASGHTSQSMMSLVRS